MQNTRNAKPEMLRAQHFTKKVKKISTSIGKSSFII